MNPEPTEVARIEVSVGIATFRRHVELRRLLESLVLVDRPQGLLRWVSTVVVDNSPDADAREVVASLSGLDIPGLTYVHEPSPGLSAARNALVDRSVGDFVAFVDDDEVPTPVWLVEMERVLAQQPGAQAIVGPVHYIFEQPEPRWLEQAGIFEPMSMVEHEPPEYFATGNAMVRRDLVEVLGPLFDPFFGELGGEDHHLGLRLEQINAKILAAPNALVHEYVPAERVDKKWAAKRLLRKGSSLALTESRLVGGGSQTRTRARHALAGVARVGVGAVQVLASLPIRSRSPWGGLRLVLMGFGQISGASGRTVREYRRSA